jgi:hypothetical protein
MIGIFALIAIVVFTIQVYKTANGTGRNGALWALLTAGVGLGLQIVIPFIIGIVLAIAYLVMGSSPETLESEITGPATIIGIIGLILSIVGMVLISKHVAKVPDDPPMSAAVPPPPPQF